MIDSKNTMSSIEDLYDQLGGMGRFQVMTSLLIGLCQVPIGWSMLQMSFAGVIPDFHCLVEKFRIVQDQSTSSFADFWSDGFSRNETLEACSLNGTSCDGFIYDTAATTVITEWGLVCDKSWVKKVIIAIQMAGVLVGTVAAGQLSDILGRKKVLYVSVVCHVALNIIAAFSVNWVMFSCLRFLIGMFIGAVIVVVGTYQLEFLPIKWRPLLGILPTFTLGLTIFAGTAALLENWSYLHFGCALLSLVSLFGAFFVPESPRWLSVQGRLDDAEQVINRISSMNRKPVPSETSAILRSIQNKNFESNKATQRFTYIDLFRRKQSAKLSLVFFYYWFILAVVYYGISFGIGSFSGNLYLNIFLLGVMEIPVQTTTFCLNNKIGRRKTTLLFFALCCISLLGCLVFSETTSGETEDISINALSLIAKMMIGSAWSSVQVWGTESFPTVTRNLGCGFSALGARVGGILAPFIIDLDSMMSLSYAICCVLLVVGSVLVFFIPESKGKTLKDTLKGMNACESFETPLTNELFNYKESVERDSVLDPFYNELKDTKVEAEPKA